MDFLKPICYSLKGSVVTRNRHYSKVLFSMTNKESDDWPICINTSQFLCIDLTHWTIERIDHFRAASPLPMRISTVLAREVTLASSTHYHFFVHLYGRGNNESNIFRISVLYITLVNLLSLPFVNKIRAMEESITYYRSFWLKYEYSYYEYWVFQYLNAICYKLLAC